MENMAGEPENTTFIDYRNKSNYCRKKGRVGGVSIFVGTDNVIKTECFSISAFTEDNILEACAVKFKILGHSVTYFLVWV